MCSDCRRNGSPMPTVKILSDGYLQTLALPANKGTMSTSAAAETSRTREGSVIPEPLDIAMSASSRAPSVAPPSTATVAMLNTPATPATSHAHAASIPSHASATSALSHNSTATVSLHTTQEDSVAHVTTSVDTASSTLSPVEKLKAHRNARTSLPLHLMNVSTIATPSTPSRNRSTPRPSVSPSLGSRCTSKTMSSETTQGANSPRAPRAQHSAPKSSKTATPSTPSRRQRSSSSTSSTTPRHGSKSPVPMQEGPLPPPYSEEELTTTETVPNQRLLARRLLHPPTTPIRPRRKRAPPQIQIPAPTPPQDRHNMFRPEMSSPLSSHSFVANNMEDDDLGFGWPDPNKLPANPIWSKAYSQGNTDVVLDKTDTFSGVLAQDSPPSQATANVAPPAKLPILVEANISVMSLGVSVGSSGSGYVAGDTVSLSSDGTSATATGTSARGVALKPLEGLAAAIFFDDGHAHIEWSKQAPALPAPVFKSHPPSHSPASLSHKVTPTARAKKPSSRVQKRRRRSSSPTLTPKSMDTTPSKPPAQQTYSKASRQQELFSVLSSSAVAGTS
jgi:hypothetical protein